MPDKEAGVTVTEINERINGDSQYYPSVVDKLKLDNERLTEAVDRQIETIAELDRKAKHWHDLVVKLSTKLAAIEMLCGAK